MPAIEEFVVHAFYYEAIAGRLTCCGKVGNATNLIVSDEEFHKRAGGVCKVCSQSGEWKIREARLLRKG